MNLKDYVESLREEGFKIDRAKVKVCQEILMQKLLKSRYRDCVTFKGGTIMYQLTKNIRRSTNDVDIDLIKMSISKENIIAVFNEIGKESIDIGINFYVNSKSIIELNHDNYKGKRVELVFKDRTGYKLNLKMDIGVHNNTHIEQDLLLFNIKITDSVLQVLVNPVEQMIVEKTIACINYGILSTRMKDVFDIYYLITNQKIATKKIVDYIELLIIKPGISENLKDYVDDLIDFFESKEIRVKLSSSDNWTEKSIDTINRILIDFFEGLTQV